MKVIVCGAGQVGTSIVHPLAAENNDVTVVDQSPELIQKLSDSLDVKAMEGFASHPDVLEAAGAANDHFHGVCTLDLIDPEPVRPGPFPRWRCPGT